MDEEEAVMLIKGNPDDAATVFKGSPVNKSMIAY